MSSKIVKPGKQEPDAFELKVAQEIQAIQDGNSEIKDDLSKLHIVSAKEQDIAGGQKAIILFVPCPLLKAFHKIQKTLVRELEKKFADHHVVIVAQRTILGKAWKRTKNHGPLPRSRTITNVHEAILEDLVFPTEIVGKRTRYGTDGSKLLKVYLDPSEQTVVETKLETFSVLYKKLTQRDVSFQFPLKN